ncbi:MAG: hypothetical protein EPO13_07885 [Actinomycetota bacterium]|nr:MAG: hypothetical protein EPO13_07885 [Actinomycetota bacterium]
MRAQLPPIRVGLIAVGIVILLALIGTAVARSGPAAPPSSVVVPVGSVTVVCPEAGSGDVDTVRTSAAVVPGLPGQDRPGAAVLRTQAGDASATATVTAPGGQAEIVSTQLARPAVVGHADGGLAPGFVADQFGVDGRGRDRGLASTACQSPAADQWFVGGGGTTGRVSRVILVNADEAAAQVDVLLVGPAGPIEAPAGRGVVVPPGGRTTLRLDALAPGVADLAVHVAVRSGRVAAGVHDSESAGIDPRGVDWVPLAAAPATRVVLPAIPAGAGSRVLQVVSPTADARVAIRVVTGSGAFSPAGQENLDAPRARLSSVDLTAALGGAAGAVELTSDVPVVAGLRARSAGAVIDESYSAGASPLTGPAAVTGLPGQPGLATSIVVSASGAGGAADLTLLGYTAAGVAVPTPPRRIDVADATTVAVGVTPPPGAAWFTAVLTPVAGGPLYAGHTVTQPVPNGVAMTGYPWSPLRVTVVVPAVDADLAVTLRR